MIYNLQEHDANYNSSLVESHFIETDIPQSMLEELIKEFHEKKFQDSLDNLIGFTFEDFKIFLIKKKIGFKVVDVVDIIYNEYDSS